ncbi:MAG: hypothetical protein N2491_12900 [Negativicutes bacterium]|nr:hypothetical protein [Negativicutes bacterium]
MWQEMFELFAVTLAVALCSAAVKLLDDFLDQDIDLSTGRKNWAEFLGRGTMVYASLLLSFAASIHTSAAISLFLACYAVGMFSSLTKRLPSSLRGWQESLFVLLAGMYFFGWKQMLFSLSFVVAVQLIDDIIDYRSDASSGQRNWAHRLGILECALGALLAILLAWSANERMIAPAVIGTGLVYAAAFVRQEVRLWPWNF